jgi:phosphotriesterase-related protein
MNPQWIGQVMTVRGPVAPGELGAVLMHEHCYARLDAVEEGPTAPEQADFARKYFVPYFRELHRHGCHAFVDATPLPMRAWPDLYLALAEYADTHIIMSTGFYREAEPDAPYFSGHGLEHRWIYWRAKREPAEALADMMVCEFEEGIHGYPVRPGIIKLATSGAELTPLERRCFEAGVLTHRATGLAITTHAVGNDSFSAQFDLLTRLGTSPDRIILGHTGGALINNYGRVRECMSAGATFLPTNLEVPDPEGEGATWQPLVDALKRVFDEGLGDRLVLGLDWAYCNERGEFGPGQPYGPGRVPPFVHLFTNVLPLFRRLGLEEAAIEMMLVQNPARLLPIAG